MSGASRLGIALGAIVLAAVVGHTTRPWTATIPPAPKPRPIQSAHRVSLPKKWADEAFQDNRGPASTSIVPVCDPSGVGEANDIACSRGDWWPPDPAPTNSPRVVYITPDECLDAHRGKTIGFEHNLSSETWYCQNESGRIVVMTISRVVPR